MPPTRTNSVPAVLAAALGYAARGWHVFPLRPDDKRPAFPDHRADACTGRDPRCARAGRHVEWSARATTDPDRITRAWSRPTPRGPYGIGIACGPCGLLVLDLDTPKPGQAPPPEWRLPGVVDGADTFAVVCERAGQPGPISTYTVRTGRGGLHRYFTQPPGPPLGNTTGSLGWLIDTRGAGGYVVAPPSTATGLPYTVERDAPLAVLPGWLAAALRPAPLPEPGPISVPLGPSQGGPGGRAEARAEAYLQAAVDAETRRVRDATSGGRNHALFTAAIALGQLAAGGATTPAHVRAVLLNAAAAHLGIDGFTRHEAETTITSGLRRGATRPRTLTHQETA